jgi:hypothetical protein
MDYYGSAPMATPMSPSPLVGEGAPKGRERGEAVQIEPALP